MIIMIWFIIVISTISSVMLIFIITSMNYVWLLSMYYL